MEERAVGLAAYERVVATIRQDIAEGRLASGTRLPGNRALAEQYNVSLPTLQKAVKVLQDDGWLVTRPSVGVFVVDQVPSNEPPVTIQDLHRSLGALQARVEAMEGRLRQLKTN